jgi:hypothetical protein
MSTCYIMLYVVLCITRALIHFPINLLKLVATHVSHILTL